MPVPAGMSLPMMMFSFNPSRLSLRPSMAASVSTRVVSWNDAADSHESVASDAFVMPMSSGRPSAGRLPSSTSRRVLSAENPALALLVLAEADDAGALGHDGRALGLAGLEQLDDTRQTVGDVLAGDAAGVECPHGELRTGLADRLGSDDPDG